MKYRILLGLGSVFALILGSCAPTSATEVPALPTAATSPTTASETIVKVSLSQDGLILVNGEGRSLYLFMADTQGSGVSTCYQDDGCSSDWPAFVSEGEPLAGEDLDATLLGTITRDDGTTQVTYNGWPLYYYHLDVMPGDGYGQGLDKFGGLWYVVSPAGEAVQEKK